MLDDGTQITESATIQTICRGRKQTVTHTDSHGGFSFEFGDRTSAAAAGISERRRRFVLEPGQSAPEEAASVTGAIANCRLIFPDSLRSPSI